eukprot:INCI14759.9.p1 GENE.INCI14759.9~~INCI14759.9.p1  ORF type:complete len:127 (+),score=10.48 INCI14759.9:500-880(+)
MRRKIWRTQFHATLAKLALRDPVFTVSRTSNRVFFIYYDFVSMVFNCRTAGMLDQVNPKSRFTLAPRIRSQREQTQWRDKVLLRNKTDVGNSVRWFVPRQKKLKMWRNMEYAFSTSGNFAHACGSS